MQEEAAREGIRFKFPWPLATLALGLFVLDRVIKWWAQQGAARQGDWFSFAYLENQAGAFSWPLPLPVLAVAGSLALLAVCWLGAQALQRSSPRRFLGAALMFVGGCSNLFDRLGGGVIDVFHVSSRLSFNLSDLYLIIGLLLLVI